MKEDGGAAPATNEAPPVPFIVDAATDEVLRIHLDKFEGPFEVLLYLIKAQEIDIFDIPIAKITDQYLKFLELVREENLEVIGDFLVMAATLIQIKSKMLLPIEYDPDEEEAEEDDPRLELVEKLIEYRKFRDVAQRLQFLEQERANWFARNVPACVEPPAPEEQEYTEVSLYDLIDAFRKMLPFIREGLTHTIEGERYSVDEKINWIENLLAENESVAWIDLFRGCTNRIELICYFLAILELCRMGRVRAHQHGTFGDIRLFRSAEAPAN